MTLGRSLILVLALVAVAAPANAASENIYDEKADAHKLISAAVSEAARSRKNIVLDFGANWCGDCHALDAEMRKPELASLIEKNYVVVHVDVGRFDKNLDLAKSYGNPIKKGIPAAVLLTPDNQVLYASKGGELADARHMGDNGVYDFFNQVLNKH